MNEQFRILLGVWDWRPAVWVPLLLLGTLYLTGWLRLRRRGGRGGVANGWRLASYLGGLLLLVAALLSPIEELSSWLFTYHMIQHLLLVMLAPPLLLLANPLPFLLWGLPAGGRRAAGHAIGRLIGGRSPGRRLLRQVTNVGVVWFLYVGALILWHDPGAYDLALRRQWIHDLEHVSFFVTAMLYWWLATGAGPRIHKPLGAPGRIAYLLGALPANWFVGVSLALATEPVYQHYVAMPRIGMGVLQDLIVGGFIMWVPGSMMYILFALVVLGRWINQPAPAGGGSAPAARPALAAPLTEK